MTGAPLGNPVTASHRRDAHARGPVSAVDQARVWSDAGCPVASVARRSRCADRLRQRSARDRYHRV